MRIKKIHLQSFRNHTDSTLELEQFNVLRGSNFSGKSSISQALSMLLTPTTTSLDATGRGFNVKIQHGAQKATITGIIQGIKHIIEQTVVLNHNTTGRTSRAVCLSDPEFHPSPFERLLDSNKAALSVALNTDRWFSMDEKDQKSLLAKLALPKKHDFPEDKMDAVNAAIGEGVIDFDADPFSVIEKAYKLLYKEREAVNRQVKDFAIPEPLAGSSVDAAALQTQLVEARERQKVALAERDEEMRKHHEADLKRSRLSSKAEALKEKIDAEQERIALIEKRILSDERLKNFTKVAEGKAALDKLESERQLVLAKISTKKSKSEGFAPLLGAKGEECPTCHQEVDGGMITEMYEKACVELITAQNRDTELLQQMKSLGDVAGALKAIADNEQALKEKEEIRTVIIEKQKLLQDVNSELDKLPVSDSLLPISLEDDPIPYILSKLTPALAAEERKKEIATKTEQLKRLQAKAASVDSLVKYFDKDGIKAELLAEHIGSFEEKMNAVLSAWGYEVTVAIEPEFEFTVRDTHNVITPVKELSGSEQLMFSVALQCAVSKSAGIGIVVADRLDTFLPAERSKCNKILYTLVRDGVLEQVIAIMSDTSETKADLPNSAFFFVENGTVRRL